MTERLHFHFSLSCIGEGNGNPLQCSCLENPRNRGACWAAVYGVSQSRTQLTDLAVVAAFFSFTPWIRHHPVRIWKKKMQYYWQFIFIFTGLTYQPNGRSSCHWCSLWYISPLLRGPLIWLLCYGMTPHLHMPMYLFLENLAFADF